MTNSSYGISIPIELLQKGGQGEVCVDGYRLTVRIRKGTTKNIAFLFQGAVKRDLRELPVFQPFLPGNTRLTQVSISDDSLLHTPQTSTGWYLGHETLPLFDLLPRLFIAFCNAFESSAPPIFVGGSSGGFAALYYANLHENSIAVVANPQTNLYTYKTKFGSGVQQYLRGCWTNSDNVKTLPEKICLDLAVPYSQPGSNSVIYLQSGGDRKHLHSQMGDFLGAIHGSRWPDFTVKVGFWGKLGHSASIPYSYVSEIVDLVSRHPAANSDDLLQLPHFNSDLKSTADSKTEKTSKSNANEISKTDLINDFLLS